MIDAQIPLQVKPIQAPDRLNMMAQVLGIQANQNQNALAQYSLSRAQREDTRQNALDRAYQGALGPDGAVNKTALFSALVDNGYGSAIPDIQKKLTEADTAQATLQGTQTENQNKVMAQFRNNIPNTPQGAAVWLNAQYDHPVLGKLAASLMPRDEALASIPTDPAQFDDWRKQASLGLTKLMELNKPTIHVQPLGSTSNIVSVPGMGGPPTVLSSTPIAQSLDNVASNAARVQAANIGQEGANARADAQRRIEAFKADPLGVFGINPGGIAAPGGAQPAPGAPMPPAAGVPAAPGGAVVPMQNDKPGTAGVDRQAILRGEYQKAVADVNNPALTPEQVQRRQQDIVALQNEAKGLHFNLDAQPVGLPAGQPAPQAPGQPAQAPAQGLQGLQGLSGDALLAKLPPAIASQVKALAEGRLQVSPMMQRSPQGNALLTLAMQYEPGTDATVYSRRAATAKDAATGKLATSTNALNTVTEHLAGLADAASALNNTRFPWVNSVVNWVESNAGDPRVKTFNLNMQGVASELERAYRGAGGSEGDIKLWRENLNSANSPEQFRSVMAKGAEMLQSKLEANQAQYDQGMSGLKGGWQAITPKASGALTKLRGGAQATPGGSAPGRPTVSNW